MRGLILSAAIGLAALFAGGCADDCETACGKLDFCNQLKTMDVFACVDSCGRTEAGSVARCAGCLDGASCNGISTGSCASACESLER